MTHPGSTLWRAKPPAVEWATIALTLGCYAVWGLAGCLYAISPILGLILLAAPIALHSSLQHEALHGHPTRQTWINEALVYLPLGLFYPYRRYKHLHLRHHDDQGLTDPYDDPESYYLARGDWGALPSPVRRVLGWNNALVGRVVLGPAIAVATFLLAEVRDQPQQSDAHAAGRRLAAAWTWAWVLHLVGLVPLLLIVHLVFHMPIWVYLTSAYLGAAIVSIRSFCEHRWSADPRERTVIVERTWLGPLFLNNNLHLVHHTCPGVAWHRLPQVYRSERERWLAMNGGYVFNGYSDVLRRHGLRAKEPVVHPALYTQAERAHRGARVLAAAGQAGEPAA